MDMQWARNRYSTSGEVEVELQVPGHTSGPDESNPDFEKIRRFTSEEEFHATRSIAEDTADAAEVDELLGGKTRSFKKLRTGPGDSKLPNTTSERRITPSKVAKADMASSTALVTSQPGKASNFEPGPKTKVKKSVPNSTPKKPEAKSKEPTASAIPANLFLIWTNKNYLITEPEIQLMTDLIDQIARTVRRRTICVPWFAVCSLFNGEGEIVPVLEMLEDSALRVQFYDKSSEEKTVSTPNVDGLGWSELSIGDVCV